LDNNVLIFIFSLEDMPVQSDNSLMEVK